MKNLLFHRSRAKNNNNSYLCTIHVLGDLLAHPASVLSLTPINLDVIRKNTCQVDIDIQRPSIDDSLDFRCRVAQIIRIQS